MTALLADLSEATRLIRHVTARPPRPAYSVHQAALDRTFTVYGCTFLGFMAGVAFMLMAGRMGFLDALSAGGL